jgi:amino acid efflux transporter
MSGRYLLWPLGLAAAALLYQRLSGRGNRGEAGRVPEESDTRVEVVETG